MKTIWTAAVILALGLAGGCDAWNSYAIRGQVTTRADFVRVRRAREQTTPLDGVPDATVTVTMKTFGPLSCTVKTDARGHFEVLHQEFGSPFEPGDEDLVDVKVSKPGFEDWSAKLPLRDFHTFDASPLDGGSYRYLVIPLAPQQGR